MPRPHKSNTMLSNKEYKRWSTNCKAAKFLHTFFASGILDEDSVKDSNYIIKIYNKPDNKELQCHQQETIWEKAREMALEMLKRKEGDGK